MSKYRKMASTDCEPAIELVGWLIIGTVQAEVRAGAQRLQELAGFAASKQDAVEEQAAHVAATIQHLQSAIATKDTLIADLQVIFSIQCANNSCFRYCHSPCTHLLGCLLLLASLSMRSGGMGTPL